jgi:MSHA biogenesis protein MshM
LQARRVPGYLAHRLQRAALDAHTDIRVFTPAAAQAIAQASGGVPRLINILANKCLMLAYGEDRLRVHASHVRLAARDTPGVVPVAPWWRRWWSGAPGAGGNAHGEAWK